MTNKLGCCSDLALVHASAPHVPHVKCRSWRPHTFRPTSSLQMIQRKSTRKSGLLCSRAFAPSLTCSGSCGSFFLSSMMASSAAGFCLHSSHICVVDACMHGHASMVKGWLKAHQGRADAPSSTAHCGKHGNELQLLLC